MNYKLPLFTFKRILLSVVFHSCLLAETPLPIVLSQGPLLIYFFFENVMRITKVKYYPLPRNEQDEISIRNTT